MSLNDYEAQIVRLNEKIRNNEADIFSLEGKVKIRDEINQEIMQEKFNIEEQLENKLSLTGSLEVNSIKLMKEK